MTMTCCSLSQIPAYPEEKPKGIQSWLPTLHPILYPHGSVSTAGLPRPSKHRRRKRRTQQSWLRGACGSCWAGQPSATSKTLSSLFLCELTVPSHPGSAPLPDDCSRSPASPCQLPLVPSTPVRGKEMGQLSCCGEVSPFLVSADPVSHSEASTQWPPAVCGEQ